MGHYLSGVVPAVRQKLISLKLKARSTNQNKATTAVMTEPFFEVTFAVKAVTTPTTCRKAEPKVGAPCQRLAS